MAVLGYRPAEQLPRVRVDGIQVAAVGGQCLIAQALSRPPGSSRAYRGPQAELAVSGELVARDGPVPEIGHEREPAVAGDHRPAHFGAGAADRAGDQSQLAVTRYLVGGRGGLAGRPAERFGDQYRPG